MFGASVSELYLLIKLLINIEDNRSMCDHKRKYTCIHRNCESGLAIIYKHAASLAGQPTSAQRGKGLVNELTDVCSRFCWLRTNRVADFCHMINYLVIMARCYKISSSCQL